MEKTKIEMKVVVKNNMALVTDSEKANASENSKQLQLTFF
jgi:hypothetical protein